MSPLSKSRNPTLLEWRIPADEWNWNPLGLSPPFGVIFDISVVTLGGAALPSLMLGGLALLFTGESFSLEALGYISIFFGGLSLLVVSYFVYFVNGRVHIQERGVKFGFPSDLRPGYWSWTEVKDFSLTSQTRITGEDRNNQNNTFPEEMKEMVLDTIYGAQLRRTVPSSVSVPKLRQLLASRLASAKSLNDEDFELGPFHYYLLRVGAIFFFLATAFAVYTGLTGADGATWARAVVYGPIGLGFAGWFFVSANSTLELKQDGIRATWLWWRGSTWISYREIRKVEFRALTQPGVYIHTTKHLLPVGLAGIQEQFAVGRTIARRAALHGGTIEGVVSGDVDNPIDFDVDDSGENSVA